MPTPRPPMSNGPQPISRPLSRGRGVSVASCVRDATNPGRRVRPKPKAYPTGKRLPRLSPGREPSRSFLLASIHEQTSVGRPIFVTCSVRHRRGHSASPCTVGLPVHGWVDGRAGRLRLRRAVMRFGCSMNRSRSCRRYNVRSRAGEEGREQPIPCQHCDSVLSGCRVHGGHLRSPRCRHGRHAWV
jgi:hypothetical protein